MKFIVFLTTLIINNVMANTDSTFELKSENIELLALNHSSDATIKKYVMNLIKTKHPKEYYPIIKDKAKVAKLVDKYTKAVKSKASKLSKTTDFLLEKNIHFAKVNEESSTLSIKSFLIGNSMPISTNKLTDDGMPSNFLLLIPNTDMMNNFKVDINQFNNIIEKRTNKRDKSLFMQVIVNLVKFQNQDNFQTVIKEVKIYDSQNKNQLLASKSEKTKTTDLIENWLLSDGYTNKLIGIHAFSFFGYRLQDQLRTVNSIKGYCDKTKKLGKHQVIVCNRHFKENILIVTTYIGGILAKIDLLAKSPLTNAEKQIIMQKMNMNLKQPKSILKHKHLHWQRYRTDFDFYSDAIKGIKSKESQYKYEFGTNNNYKDLDLTLIMSIMSHDTKKFIEKHQ